MTTENTGLDWNKIYNETSFMVKDISGTEITFTHDIGLPSSIKNIKFAIITAWNPDNKIISDSENRIRNQSLEGDLEKLSYVYYPSSGTGTDGHSEASFTIEGISAEQAVALGTKYGQYAIVYNDSEGFVFKRCVK